MVPFVLSHGDTICFMVPFTTLYLLFCHMVVPFVLSHGGTFCFVTWWYLLFCHMVVPLVLSHGANVMVALLTVGLIKKPGDHRVNRHEGLGG